jgi:hypothetical protein
MQDGHFMGRPSAAQIGTTTALDGEIDHKPTQPRSLQLTPVTNYRPPTTTIAPPSTSNTSYHSVESIKHLR